MFLNMKEEFKMPDKVKRQTNAVVSRLASFGIEDFINNELSLPSGYLLRNPGKLMRPSLVFLGADYVGIEDLGKYIELASAIELLHISSMIHDDIIDKDATRRGGQATHVRYGIESAILAGDALIAKAIQEANGYGREVVDLISKTAMKMSAGEIVDYRYQKNGIIPNLREYLKVAELKSSSLIGVSTSIAALHAEDHRVNKLYEFGMSLGTAFQIRDDIIDFFDPGRNKKSGYTLNIVACIKEHEKVDTGSALLSAADLNRKYVRNARSKLGNRKGAALFKEYAGRVEVNLDKETVLNNV